MMAAALLGLVAAVVVCVILILSSVKVHAGKNKVPPELVEPELPPNPFVYDPIRALRYLFAGTDAFPSGSSSPYVLERGTAQQTANTLVAGTEYDELGFRQSDCTITEAAGDFTASYSGVGNLEAIATTPNNQTLIRNASGLTTPPPASLYPKGCSNSTIGAMSTQSTIFTTQLANGNYVGASISNSGVNTFVSQQLNGAVTSSYHDTSNGSATSEAFGLGTADLNGDGIPDLAVLNFDYASPATGNTIAVLLAKSDGTFQAPSYISNAFSSTKSGGGYTLPGGFTLVDLNGDGKLDIVFEESTAGALSIAFVAGKGDGTFAAPVTAAAIQNGAIPVGNLNPAAVAAADVNSDGHIDVVDANGLVFLGDGKGNLQQVAASGLLDTTNASATGQYVGLTIADFNGDGKADLALTENAQGAVLIAMGNGDGTFMSGNSYATGENPVELSATDLDGDGNMDLVVGISSGGVFAPGSQSIGLTQFILGKGDGTFASLRYFPSRNSSAISADFNGDGHTDVLGLGVGGLQLSIGNRDGTFQTPGVATTVSIPGSLLLSGDLNGDGKQDVVVVAGVSGTGSFVSLLGNGNGTFQTPSPVQQVPNNSAVIQAVLGDFNGDGKLDLAMIVVTISNNGVLYLFAGNGDGTFASPKTLDTYAANITSNQLQAIDLNRDGKLDLVTITGPQGQITAPTINIYLGKGDGTFTASTIPSVGGQSFSSPQPYFGAGDVNGDGFPDLIVAGGFAGQPVTAILLLGNGDGTFKVGTNLNIGNNYSPLGPIQIQDLNNDGKADLFYSIQGDHAIAFGNGDGTFSNQIMVRVTWTGSFVSAEDLDGDGKTDLLLAGAYGGIVPILTKGYGSLAGNSVSTTTLTISPNPAAVGQAVAFTATVAAGGGATGTPTGTVTFLSGSTNLGTGTLSSGSATFSTSLLEAGTYSVTAVYGGDSTFASSTSPAVSLTVIAAPTTIATSTTLSASTTNATAGTNLMFTSSVAAASGGNVPTGTVTFTDGTSQLGTGTLDNTGKATYSTSSLAVGAHSIIAAYGGNSSYTASASSPVAVTIAAAPADFSISLAQTSGTVSNGNSVTSGITITPINGFNEAVTLACSGAPSNAICSINPTSVIPTGTSPSSATLTVKTGIKAATLVRPDFLDRSSGTVAWSFLGGGGLLVFSLLRLRRSLWTQFLAILTLSGGLIGVATGCGSSGHSTPGGTYTITVAATSGADSHTATYSLTVQ